MNPNDRLQESADLFPDDDGNTETIRAELESAGVQFEEDDDMTNPNVQDDPQEWDDGGFAVMEGAAFPEDDDPEWEYELTRDDPWDDEDWEIFYDDEWDDDDDEQDW